MLLKDCQVLHDFSLNRMPFTKEESKTMAKIRAGEVMTLEFKLPGSSPR